jgi:hypothetical protein
VQQCIHFTNMREELITQSFPLTRAFNQTGDITDFERTIGRLLGFKYLSQREQTWIRNQRNPGVGINGRSASRSFRNKVPYLTS